ncbi:MAG: NhaA family Na+:H+ antiporter [Candidatus Azotimanducaceae bacterium]|jgi:NhaA family Na+:H+ antiporter
MTGIKEFLRLEAAGGIVLVVAAVLAMLVANSALSPYYESLLSVPFTITLGEAGISKPVLLWINDGLMAIFFFLIGLEIKREYLVGELSDPSKVMLPVIAAVGGMAAPALIYAALNWEDPIALAGWAIPSATDIAFALGVLSLLGDRVPSSLKLFLMTLAIVDDLGAIVIIALFYTVDLSTLALAIASAALGVLYLMNRRGVLSMAAYLFVGLILWVSVLKSGVHATLAGVLIAFMIPHRCEPGATVTQLEKLEHDLHPLIAFGILPLFAFANTGISLAGVTFDMLLHPIPLGIALGLFLGNQLGIFGLSWLAIKLKIAELPAGATWLQLYGVGMLCGIGFTMSLFVSSLAFEQGGHVAVVDDRLGILLGTLASAIGGYCLLRFTGSAKQAGAGDPVD